MDLVLLIDPDADTRQMYAEYLSHAGWDTEEAEDGREGLAKAISHRPAAIVTETRLPGMSGLELCRLLRSDAATNTTPIVVVTGDASTASASLAATAGADAVLVKPCLPERLAGELQRLVSRAVTTRADAQSAPAPGRARHQRITSDPPDPPPALHCPACDRPMTYVKSQIGGVSERFAEQWDYFECAPCGGAVEYRQRTRTVRPLPSSMLRARRA